MAGRSEAEERTGAQTFSGETRALLRGRCEASLAQFAKHIRPPGLGASNRATEREDIKTMLNWIKVTASSGDTVFIFVDHIRAIVETARGSTIITHQLDDGIPVLEYPEVLLAQIAEIAVERRAGPGW